MTDRLRTLPGLGLAPGDPLYQLEEQLWDMGLSRGQVATICYLVHEMRDGGLHDPGQATRGEPDNVSYPEQP